jgi:hypothetical protein
MPELKGSLGGHAFRRMLEERISVSINTDNRTVSNTTMVNELKIAVETFAMTPKQLKEIVINGFKRSFFCRPYCEKRKFVRQVRPAPAARWYCCFVMLALPALSQIMDYYDRVEAEHFGAGGAQ